MYKRLSSPEGMNLYEIRFHGRGGQGTVIASELLVNAAFSEGHCVSAYPYFGVERRGAPVTAFARISEENVLIKSGIYYPDFVIVLDESLISGVDVLAGLSSGGSILVNSRRDPSALPFNSDHRKFTVDATAIALKYGLGNRTSPIVNTAILGAFARISPIVSLEAIIGAIRKITPRKREENVSAAIEAYENVKGVIIDASG